MEPQPGEMAALEEQLRAALAARSALVTARSLRPHTPFRPGRVAWRWPRLLLAIGAVAAAFLIVITMAAFLHRPAERDLPAAASGRVNLQGVSFQVPRGWTAWQPEPGIQACVQPRGIPHDIDHCWATGIQVATQTGDQSGSLEDKDWPRTWLDCWAADGRVNFSDEITGSRLVARATLPVAGHQATYRAWQVTCHSGQRFTARLWWIPRNQISIRAFHLDAREAPLAEALVSTITLR